MSRYYTTDDYTTVEKCDAHMHLNTDDESFVKHSLEDNFRLLTINIDVGSDFPNLKTQEDLAERQSKKFPGIVYYACTFPVRNFNNESFEKETIAALKSSISKGAIAVKIWKNIGMELKDSKGNFVMIDHPKFDPVIDFLAKRDIPLIGHLGEPKNCWLPIEKMTVQGDVNYFSAHPEYHMYLHPEYPSYEDQINARDNMLAKHPDLQFIGAHFGSLEWSIDEISKRLDRFANMAVDTAERISHLQLQAINNWQGVRDFFIRYQDRIIYGTDIIADGTKATEEMRKHAHDIRMRHWKFFTSDEIMRVPKVDGEFRGLNLESEVVDKIYRTNAAKWFRLQPSAG